jgi:glycosyltransferase involved in cell wall biosynthesis
MFDACSNTVLEAQSCGLPILYSNTGGTPEIVSYGYPIDYSNKPCDMIQFALSKKKELQPKDFESTFGLERMGEQYDALIRTLCAKQHEV